MAFVQYGHLTDAERAADQRDRDLDARKKDWDLSHSTISVKMDILLRGGNDGYKAEIIDLARKYVCELEQLVDAAPPVMITKQQNRY